MFASSNFHQQKEFRKRNKIEFFASYFMRLFVETCHSITTYDCKISTKLHKNFTYSDLNGSVLQKEQFLFWLQKMNQNESTFFKKEKKDSNLIKYKLKSKYIRSIKKYHIILVDFNLDNDNLKSFFAYQQIPKLNQCSHYWNFFVKNQNCTVLLDEKCKIRLIHCNCVFYCIEQDFKQISNRFLSSNTVNKLYKSSSNCNSYDDYIIDKNGWITARNSQNDDFNLMHSKIYTKQDIFIALKKAFFCSDVHDDILKIICEFADNIVNYVVDNCVKRIGLLECLYVNKSVQIDKQLIFNDIERLLCPKFKFQFSNNSRITDYNFFLINVKNSVDSRDEFCVEQNYYTKLQYFDGIYVNGYYEKTNEGSFNFALQVIYENDGQDAPLDKPYYDKNQYLFGYCHITVPCFQC